MNTFAKIIGVSALSIGLLAACNDTDDVAKGDTPLPPAEESTTTSITPVAVGTPVTVDHFKVTVNNVRTQETKAKTADEKQTILVDITAVNNTLKQQRIQPLLAISLVDEKGTKYLPAASLTEFQQPFSGSVGIGDSLQGFLAFDVPKDSTYTLRVAAPHVPKTMMWTIASATN